MAAFAFGVVKVGFALCAVGEAMVDGLAELVHLVDGDAFAEFTVDHFDDAETKFFVEGKLGREGVVDGCHGCFAVVADGQVHPDEQQPESVTVGSPPAVAGSVSGDEDVDSV